MFEFNGKQIKDLTDEEYLEFCKTVLNMEITQEEVTEMRLNSGKYAEIFNTPTPELIKEYDRLNNTNISKKLSPIENLIDEKTGNRDTEIKEFFTFVREFIFLPLIKNKTEQ